MFRPFYAFIANRYARVKRKNHFISFISLTSVVGIALGVSVLITVLSVMNGFNKEIRVQMLNGTPHITVGKVGGSWVDWRPILSMLNKYPKVVGVAPFIYGQGMISSSDTGRVQGVLVKGVDPNQINQVYPLAQRMKQGQLSDLKPGSYNIILGKGLANNLGVVPGDKVSLIVPEATVTLAGISPRMKRFSVAGIFEIGDLYDGSQAFMHLKDADKLYHMEGGVSGLQLKLEDELEAPIVAHNLYFSLNQNHDQQEYGIVDWTQEFGGFFRALKIQKTAMLVILLLIIAVAAFNLVSSLVMMVTDKRPDIAILRALGATRKHVMGIFMIQGIYIGMKGTLAGVIFGLILSYNVTSWTNTIQRALNVELISKDVYLVNFLPSEVHAMDVVGIALITLFMSFVATLYPAWRAACIPPAEALRYE